MAEYYPLLAKAVAGLSNSTPDMRRAVYERARNALLTQLKSLDPPIADADVAKETDALDAAVARLEAELAGAKGQQPAPAEAAASASTTKPASTKPALTKPALRPNPLQPAQRPRPTMPAQRPPLRPLGASAAPAAAPPPAPLPAEPEEIEDLTAVAPPPLQTRKPESLGKKAKASPPVEVREAELPFPPDSDAEDLLDNGKDFHKPRAAEGVRLYAPQAQNSDEKRGSSFRLWIVGAIVGVVVATVAIAAWALRDRPDDLAKLKPHPVVQADQGGKIEERIGGAPADAKPEATADSGSAAAPAQAPSSAAAPAAAPAASQTTAAGAAAKPAAEASQTAPIAYRAALLVEAPQEPNKYKTYEGTVIWRVENVSSGSGQPPMMAVHADVDVPGDKLKVAMTLQKNNDPSLPASHTITIDFQVKPDTATGGIKQIGVPQMRADNVPSGEPLVGVPVPTVENSFLVGLSRGTAEATNLDLLRQRAWVDIPIMLNTGKIAKLTFEKGTTGSRAIDDAINSWKGQ
jgi:hypothetical protein